MIFKLKKLAIEIGSWIDLSDVGFLAGLGFLAYGLFLLSPPFAFIIIGAIFVFLTTWPKIRS